MPLANSTPSASTMLTGSPLTKSSSTPMTPEASKLLRFLINALLAPSSTSILPLTDEANLSQCFLSFIFSFASASGRKIVPILSPAIIRERIFSSLPFAITIGIPAFMVTLAA